MTDISTIAQNLTEARNGIWVSPDHGEVSYPAEGNDMCFAVEEISFWFRHRNRVILELLSDFPSSTTFFDIGGGNGFVASALQSAGIDVALVEPGPAGALRAKQRGVRTVIQSTFEDAGFLPNSIPAAGLFDVVEHIEREAQFLTMIHDCLRPGGTVYVTVPACKFLWSEEDVHAGDFRRYTTGELTRLLSGAGFDVRFCSYFFFCLVPPVFLLRAVPTRMGFRRAVSITATRGEHSSPPGFATAIVQKCLALEVQRIRDGKRIPLGTSCVAVATKSRTWR